MRAKHRILIAGAGGVVGAAAVEHFAALPDWQVTGLSRRPLQLPPGVRHVPADLTDAGSLPRCDARAGRHHSSAVCGAVTRSPT